MPTDPTPMATEQPLWRGKTLPSFLGRGSDLHLPALDVDPSVELVVLSASRYDALVANQHQDGHVTCGLCTSRRPEAKVMYLNGSPYCVEDGVASCYELVWEEDHG